MKHIPINERILVKPIETTTQNKSGLHIPNSSDRTKYGKIVDLGEGRKLDDGTRESFAVKKGDTVLFAKNAGIEVTLEGEEHRFLLERDILALVQED